MTYCAGWGLGGSWLFSWSLLRTLVVTPIRYLRTEKEPKIFKVYARLNEGLFHLAIYILQNYILIQLFTFYIPPTIRKMGMQGSAGQSYK